MSGKPKYWCRCRLIFDIEGPLGSWQAKVDKPFARVGSDTRSEVALPDADVPARCLYLHATEAGVFCVDLRHQRSSPRAVRGWLGPEQWIEVGRYRLRVAAAEPEGAQIAGEADLEQKGTAPLPSPILMITN